MTIINTNPFNSSTMGIVLLMSCVFLFNCASNLDADFTSFVNKVEANFEEYSESDWDKADARFDELLLKSQKLDARLSDDQKKIINQQVGRYQALKFKHEAVDVFNEIEDVVDQIGGFVDELANDTNDYE